MASSGLQVEMNVIVQATCPRVMRAFFDPHDLTRWWQVLRSVTMPRTLGMYAVEWETTEFRDEVLGRLGGAFHGTVMDYRPDEEFFVADAYWIPPDGEPIGPMALVVTCKPHGGHHTNVSIRQTGEDDGIRWQRYFEIVARGWERALSELQEHLDQESTGNLR